jgi:hypothetical protein
LFGVIKSSEKYYFVADWTDELCDLTFKQLTEALFVAKDEVTLNSDLEDTLEGMLKDDTN